MNEAILQGAGLTKAEAHLYVLLIQHSPTTPPKLADLTNESRTNTYKLLDSLESKGLVSRDETQKKLRYWANNPSTLLESLKKRRVDVELAEKQFENSLSTMMDEYFKYSGQPSVRYFNGTEGIRKIFQDQIAEKADVYVIHAFGVVEALGVDESHTVRNEFPRQGIHRYMLYPDRKMSYPQDETTVPINVSDEAMLTTRTWIDVDDLKQPVEWALYGNKLSVMSFGAELFGMIIESPQIAASFREIFGLLDRKIRAESRYDTLPHNNLYTKIPESLKK